MWWSHPSIIVAVIILLVAVYAYTKEKFDACGTCDQTINMQKNAVINPFIYPYSGDWDADRINAQESAAQLKHRNVPDHDPHTE